MLLYLIICKPFASASNNILNIINEIILLSVFASLLGIDYASIATNTIFDLGWCLVALVLLSLLTTWVLLLPSIAKEALKFFTSLCSRAPTEASGTQAEKAPLPQPDVAPQAPLAPDTQVQVVSLPFAPPKSASFVAPCAQAPPSPLIRKQGKTKTVRAPAPVPYDE
jgi:hypothetical protein